MKLNLPAAMNNVEKDSSQAENEADSGSASEDMVSCQSFVLVNRCMAFCQFIERQYARIYSSSNTQENRNSRNEFALNLCWTKKLLLCSLFFSMKTLGFLYNSPPKLSKGFLNLIQRNCLSIWKFIKIHQSLYTLLLNIFAAFIL